MPPAEIVNLLERMSKTRSDTDRLYDTSDTAMAERFGFKARELMAKPGTDVYTTARLAASFGRRALEATTHLAHLVTDEGVH